MISQIRQQWSIPLCTMYHKLVQTCILHDCTLICFKRISYDYGIFTYEIIQRTARENFISYGLSDDLINDLYRIPKDPSKEFIINHFGRNFYDKNYPETSSDKCARSNEWLKDHLGDLLYQTKPNIVQITSQLKIKSYFSS